MGDIDELCSIKKERLSLRINMKKKLKAIDFFCSGGGMSYGLQKAGIQIIAGIDNDESCKETYLANIKDSKFINRDIFKLTPSDLENEIPSLKQNDDNLVLIGCTPCQYWSNIRTNKTKSKKLRIF